MAALNGIKFKRQVKPLDNDPPVFSLKQESRLDFFLCVIGMVMIVEGLPYFIVPDRMKVWVQKVIEIPDGSLRRFGFFLMLAGLWLVYLGKR
jgi:uncharacterized protein YjeT (DUF2065 family)